MTSSRPNFPRPDDGLSHAWGLSGPTPVEIWERFSPAYEAQAADLWDAFAARGWAPALEWAGGQDGEAIIGRDAADDPGEIVCLFHLEDPQVAQSLAAARSAGKLDAEIDQELNALSDEAAEFLD